VAAVPDAQNAMRMHFAEGGLIYECRPRGTRPDLEQGFKYPVQYPTQQEKGHTSNDMEYIPTVWIFGNRGTVTSINPSSFLLLRKLPRVRCEIAANSRKCSIFLDLGDIFSLILLSD
jgi:hypothetical protein